MKNTQKNSPVGLWAFRMSLGTLVSRILGLLRDMSIAHFFTRTQTDIFFVAFRLPNSFRRILGEGSFSAAVTPALSATLCETDGKKKAKELSSALFTLVFLVTSFLTVTGVVFMDSIMEFLFADSSFARVEGKLPQTIQAGRITFVYLFLVSAYGYFMAVAQAVGRFFLPALAPALFNGAIIVFAFLPQSLWPFPALSLAWATLAGGALQLSLVLALIYKLGFWPRLSLKINWKPVGSAFNRFVPAVLGLSGLSLIGLINLYFAGQLQEGSHTYIYYGDRLLEFPRSLIAVSLGTALLPELSRLKAKNQNQEFFRTAGRYLDFLLFLTLPCALVMALLPRPIVELLFQRGQFDRQAVIQTASVLQIYSLVLIFSSAGKALSSCFFATDRNWLCAFGNGLYVIFHGLLAWTLTVSHGLTGLIWATALSSLFYFILLFFLLFRFVGSFPLKPSLVHLLKSLPGMAVLTLILSGYQPLFDLFQNFFSERWSQLVSLFLLFPLGGVSYVFIGKFLKQKSAGEFLRLLSRRKTDKANTNSHP